MVASTAATARCFASARSAPSKSAAGVCWPRNDSVCRRRRPVRAPTGRSATGSPADRAAAPAPGRLGLGVRLLELGELGGHVQGRGEGDGRVRTGAQAREPVDEQVDHQLGAVRLGLRVVGSPSRICSTQGATSASANRAPTVWDCWPSWKVTSAPSSPPRIALTPTSVRISAPASVAHRASAPETAPRPPTGSSPVADPLVEEAAVLGERRVVQRRRDPDQAVARRDAAHGVVTEPLLDRGAERVGHEVAPDPGVHLVAHVALGRQRLEQRRGHDVRQVGDVCVELSPGIVLRAAGAPRTTPSRRPRSLDEQVVRAPARTAYAAGRRRAGGRGRDPDQPREARRSVSTARTSRCAR